MSCSISILLAVLGLTATLVPAQEPVRPQPLSGYELKVDASLVLVPTSVMSSAGDPVTHLEQDAFEIYEDGELRPLAVFEKQTAMPLQLVVMIDTSLSTANVLPVEQAAAANFLRQVLRAQDSAALYEFSGGVRRRVDFTSDLTPLQVGLLKLKPKAGTALYDAIIQVSGEIAQREGRRALVIVSDGNDTTSGRDFQAAVRAAQEAEVAIFSLVVRPIPGETGRSVRGEHVLIAFGEMTGGQVFFADSMDEIDRFFTALGDVLRTQYLLGYYPPAHNPDETFHRVEVRVRGGEYVVRHRKGYWHHYP